MHIFQGIDQLVTLIMEERGELEAEVWALRSLILLARLEVCKVKQEVEEASCKKDAVVENVAKLEFGGLLQVSEAQVGLGSLGGGLPHN